MTKLSYENIPYSPKELLASGSVRSFTGASLAQVAFPLGGIGTGAVSLGGRGDLRDWEIFNRPGIGKVLPMTFFAIRAQTPGSPGVAKVFESQILPPYTGGHGFDRRIVPGLPRLAESEFYGEYPFAKIEFRDDDLPLKVTLEAFNPFIPLNDKDSGIPVAILRYRLKNLTGKPVAATVIGSLFNAVGYNGVGSLSGVTDAIFGKNLNEFKREGQLVGLNMTSSKYAEDDPRFGSMALAAIGEDVTHTAHWTRAGWFDDLQIFWDDFTADGKLEPVESEPSPDGRTDIGSFGLLTTVPSYEEVALTFALSWYFPTRLNEWNSEEEVRRKPLTNYYATQFSDAWDVARYTLENLERLESESRLFHDALFNSTMPPYVLDAVSSQMSTMRTNTCLRLDNGEFHGFEGCSPEQGCCPMNCTHVYNYEQAVAHLFPALERSMRRTDFLFNTLDSGHMAFRSLIPLQPNVTWKFKPAADGQMGCIMKLYREWLRSGDIEFLREMWPHAKRALEFAWTSWDADKDGVMEGEQHNTYDIEFYGPNTMMGTFYLGALLAASKMAEALREPQKAKEYRDLYEQGRQKLDSELWNGEFYIQKYDETEAPKYQYGAGCLSDQLLGQWFAMVVGLGHLLPEEHVKQALASIFAYNFKTDLYNHQNCQRTYALSDEKGLLLCSWPKDGRPALPFVYSDEVWTGIEYQVAAHLIYEGMLLEGLSIVKSVRDRHDGIRRNPWNEFECGDHYARAMASWSVLLALSGYHYSAPEKMLQFAPRINAENFRTFWSTGSGWGVFTQKVDESGQMEQLKALYGSLILQRFGLTWTKAEMPRNLEVTVSKNEAKIDATLSQSDDSLVVELSESVNLETGDILTVVVKSIEV
ncbi:TPA: hypothetical protein EYP66_00350 [Candidatus Poribacteria bacterium]|nr:hypothetical protein [Candidatus Poribacteria bacterium]